MQTSFGASEAIGLLILVGLSTIYIWGWQRMRRALPTLANVPRLIAMGGAVLALGFALVWPLPDWSNYLLTMRSLQKVCICMIAAPLFWLAAPIHVSVWGLRTRLRQFFVALRTQRWTRAVMHGMSQPLTVWMIYVAVFLLWHDPTLAHYFLGEHMTHTAAPWLLLVAALLFWWPIVDSGPRFHRGFPAWMLIVSLISVEVANMVAGITIAFSVDPLYPYYAAVRAQLPDHALPWGQITDQVAGGAIVWVFGSFVYIGSVVFVLLRLFRQEGNASPLHLPNWDDHEKFIAPGLEYRAAQNRLRKTDLDHH